MVLNGYSLKKYFLNTSFGRKNLNLLSYIIFETIFELYTKFLINLVLTKNEDDGKKLNGNFYEKSV